MRLKPIAFILALTMILPLCLCSCNRTGSGEVTTAGTTVPEGTAATIEATTASTIEATTAETTPATTVSATTTTVITTTPTTTAEPEITAPETTEAAVITGEPTETAELTEPLITEMIVLSDGDIKCLEMYQFIKSYKYPPLEDTVFNFFKAYIQGDIVTATSLMDDPDNYCLSWFSTNKGSLDSVTCYGVELIYHKYYEKNGEQIETAQVDVRYFLDNWQSVSYMCISMDFIDTTDENGYTYKVWKVTHFDFEA